MESYISTRSYFEKQIKAFRDPTYDRLLPDLRPEMKAMGIKTLVGAGRGQLDSLERGRHSGIGR